MSVVDVDTAQDDHGNRENDREDAEKKKKSEDK